MASLQADLKKRIKATNGLDVIDEAAYGTTNVVVAADGRVLGGLDADWTEESVAQFLEHIFLATGLRVG